ncbi:MAG: hypothetical protein SCALA701_27890 [Candidatus Scalindua sp.]|nr:MAG: hypothetical protein SCALA701_27890 [Candidatus Scalindua sp.]
MCRRGITICLLFSFIWFIFLSEIVASPYTIYFYNPETNINNFALLKSEFDKYLSGYGPFTFQPFSDRKTFEKFVDKKRDGIFLLSSWHYQYLKEKIPIEPVYVGISKGKPTQRKILFVKENIMSIESLKGRSIASSGSEEYTKNILLRMLGKEKVSIVNSLKILTVPKDIDALMAFGFGMANAALTTEHTKAKLLTINPKLCDMLKELAGTETYLQIVAAPKQINEDIQRLLSLVEKMTSSMGGRKNLKMISLDGWKEVSSAEREYLEKR